MTMSKSSNFKLSEYFAFFNIACTNQLMAL